MIITKSTPFTKEEIDQVSEQYHIYIKTVIDLEKKICSAGPRMHYESEQILLQQGSNQENLWGGGIDTATKTIDFNSFINIRPTQNNTTNEIQDAKIREQYEVLTKFFFRELYE